MGTRPAQLLITREGTIKAVLLLEMVLELAVFRTWLKQAIG